MNETVKEVVRNEVNRLDIEIRYLDGDIACLEKILDKRRKQRQTLVKRLTDLNE